MFQAIILGLVQGITEFAPISSSGHLILVPWLFNWPIVQNPALNKSFDVFLHLGTLVGAVIYFRKDIWRYIKAFFSSIRHRTMASPDQKLAWALVIGTIPGAILGAKFEGVIEDKLGAPWLIAVSLALMAILLWVVDRRARSYRNLNNLGPRQGLFLGLAQALALQPGVSRSGITITGARALGYDRESAARFSFLLALPIIAGAGLLKTVDLAQTGLPQGMAMPFLGGFIAAAVGGFVTIWFLLRYLRSHDFTLFLIYRLAVAAIVLLVIATGLRPATI